MAAPSALLGALALVAGGPAWAGASADGSGGTIAFASFAPINTDIYLADGDGRNARPWQANPASDYDASLSRDGKWILFTSERGGDADIYRAWLDGSHLERLTDSPAFDDQAALSPDGRTVAFVSTRTGQADIWLLDLRSRRLRNLSNSPGGDFRPEWSPDGRRIAFSSDRDSTRPRSAFTRVQSTALYVINVDGTGLRRLTDADGFVGSPAWSADGRRILVFVAPVDQVTAIVSARRLHGDTQVAAIDVDRGTRNVVTSGPGEKWSPRWLPGGNFGYASGGESGGLEFVAGGSGARGEFGSPHWSTDGRRMVFHREAGIGWPPHAVVHGADRRYRLVRTGVFPAYSPDGSRLVENDGTAAIVHNDLYVMNADFSARRALVSDPAASSLAAAWSPCGDRIAFARGRFFPASLGTSTAVIATVTRDGANLTELTDGAENAGFPSWSPTGDELVYRVSTDRRSSLRIVDTRTRAIRQLTDDSGNANSPAWSPNGDRIAFTSRRGDDDDYQLYTIRPDGTGLRRITQGRGNMSHPAWSPDGQWLAFTGSEGGFKDESPLHPHNPQPYGEIMVMRADGSDLRALTDNPFEDGTPTWLPVPGKANPRCN